MSTLSNLKSDAQIASERILILDNLRRIRDLTPEEERLLEMHQSIITRWAESVK